ncbi:MAG: hypothetical protein JO250_16085 [Armatimonadetes bacterium]|nr:hypothetical protein [Armatimonadota bacterium]
MDVPRSQIQDELSRIVTSLESITGRKSRWTGNVMLSNDPSFRGKMSWNGDIVFRDSIVQQDLRWRTVIHEALHTLSVDLIPSSYFDLLGWEEGVVEKLQRLLRPVILTQLGVRVPEAVFVPVEAGHEYNAYIDALESVRGALSAPDSAFYLDLLAVPLKDRPRHVIQHGKVLPPQEFKHFQRLFAASFAVLRGD